MLKTKATRRNKFSAAKSIVQQSSTGKAGGYLIGSKHTEGGIKVINKSNPDQPIEVEGGEAVITAPALEDPTLHEWEGKKMTKRAILSDINVKAGGNAFAEKGLVLPKKIRCNGTKYKFGGKTMTDYEIVKDCGCKHKMNKGGTAKKQKWTATFFDDKDLIVLTKTYTSNNKGEADELAKKDKPDYATRYSLMPTKEAPTHAVDHKLITDVSALELSGPYAIYKGHPDQLIEYIQEQSTGMMSDRKSVNTLLSGYKTMIQFFGKGITLRCVSAIPKPQKDIIIKAWKGKALDSELRKALRTKREMPTGGPVSMPEKVHNVLLLKVSYKDQYQKAIEFFEAEKSTYFPFHYDNDYQTIDFEIRGDEYGRAIEQGLTQELTEAGITGFSFQTLHDDKMKQGGDIKNNDVKSELADGYTLDNRARDYKLLDAQVDLNQFRRGGTVPYPTFADELPTVINEQGTLFETSAPEIGAAAVTNSGQLTTGKQPAKKTVREIELSLKEVPGLEQKKLSSSVDIYEFLLEIWDKNLLNIQEQFYILCLNNANNLIGYIELSKGSVTGTVADPELVVAIAAKSLAKSVVIAHNHPSGSLKPSAADLKLTKQLSEALKLITVRLTDHIIISPNGRYYSFADEGEISYEFAGGFLKKGGDIDNYSSYHYYKGPEYKYKNAFDLNKAIEELLDSKKSIGSDNFRVEEKEFLQYYSGYGGLEKFGAEGKGLLYEYFTPALIAQTMWGLSYQHGFKGGRVLEPAAGIGEFVKYAPDKNLVTAFEINPYSARIMNILYPTTHVFVKYFEELFIVNRNTIKGKTGALEKYDLVIGNPPYGEFLGKFAGMGEKDYTRAGNYIDYFIFRGLDLLKTGGLLTFIVGAEVASGGKPFLQQQMNTCKREIAEKSELVDAYRLPNGVFERTDVLTDIIVLRKK